ncbi:MAG: zinc ribbon domain-containing protein [Chloroflexi bacterium]|nr:zinc ribbon domain-containing protein [Chloroflexota bacterium]
MPIYEYRCNACKKRTTVFLRSFSSPLSAVCEHCGGTDLARLVSKVNFVRSEESRLESLADSDMLGDVDESNPRSIARWAKKLGREVGEDLGPEFDEMVDRMEAGEMPEELMGEDGIGGEAAGVGTNAAEADDE